MWISAQTQVVGTVTSSEDGLGLPGVAIVIAGTTTGVITNLDGEYTINVPEGATTLNFSFVGMKPQVIAIDGRTVIDIVMDPDILGIEEVVVTAMGIRKEAKALGYAVQQVTGDDISKAKQMDVSKALQGKVAGVNVKQSSGMPGATSYVTIRGSTSLTGNNQPLYVVDGVPIASGKAHPEEASSGTNPSNRILDLNPDDIESINVLKGATASALYGLRASNGVIVITTKSGEAAREAGKNTLVSFNSSISMEKISRLPDLQDKYAQGNDSALDLYSGYSWGPLIKNLEPYEPQIPNADGSLTEPGIYNNQEDFFQRGHTFANSIDISSSGELGSYSLGFGRTDQQGIIPETGMKRNTAKFNGSFKPGEKWTVGVASNFATVGIDKVPGGNNLANPLFTVYSAPRTYDLTNLPFEEPGNPYIQRHYRQRMDNPYWSLKHNKFYETTDRMFGNINASYSPLDWLNITYRLGIDQYTTTGKEIISLGSGTGRSYPYIYVEIEDGVPAPDEPAGGKIDDYTYQNKELNSNFNINISKRFSDDLDFNLLLGNEIYDFGDNMNWITGTGITIGGFNDISNTSEQTVNYNFQGISRQRIIGLFYSLTLNYKSTLFMTTTGRNDYVSNMPAGNRSFFYPSIDLGFIFTQLPALQDNKALPFGKVRLSFAQVGQAGGLYVQDNVFLPARYANGFLDTKLSWEFPYNGYSGFTQSATQISTDLEPMNSRTLEAGIDLRFADSRLGIDYSFYNTNASNQIFHVPIASSTGFLTEYRNAGKLRSRGHEVILNLKPVIRDAFNWDVTINFTKYNNQVIELAEGVERIQVGYSNFPDIGTFAYAGNPYPVIFGSTYLRDDEGNIVVDDQQYLDTVTLELNPAWGMPLVGKEDILGKVNPDWESSIINSIVYKRISFSFQFDIKEGGYMQGGLNQLLRAYGAAKETENRDIPVILPAVKGHLETDLETGKDVLVSKGEKNDIEIKKNEEYWDVYLWEIAESAMFETSFIRLREIVLTYDLPDAWFENRFINSLSVYLNGRNLWLRTDYPNFDPEVSTAEGNGMGGFEYVSLPNAKSIGGGLRLSF